MKNALLISSFLIAGLLLFSCNKKEPQPTTDETSVNYTGQEKYTNNPIWEYHCDLQCLAGGFAVRVDKHIQNNVFKFTYVPIEFINVGQNHHNNLPSGVPYHFHDFIDNYPANTTNPIFDFQENQIVGSAFRYQINSNVPGWIGTQFSTSGIGSISNPCSMSTAVFYLNNAADKPAGSSDIICPSGGSISNSNQAPHPWIQMITTQTYEIFCEYDPGFCPQSPGTVEPSGPLDPVVGPAIFTYVDNQTLHVKFCRSVGGTTFEIGEQNNELNEKVIERLNLPVGTTVKPQEYDVLSDGTTYGYALLELENE
ncbi:MAG: hypothetical protein AB8B56_14250 [Crocinitomicaceae bacterium]